MIAQDESTVVRAAQSGAVLRRSVQRLQAGGSLTVGRSDLRIDSTHVDGLQLGEPEEREGEGGGGWGEEGREGGRGGWVGGREGGMRREGSPAANHSCDLVPGPEEARTSDAMQFNRRAAR